MKSTVFYWKDNQIPNTFPWLSVKSTAYSAKYCAATPAKESTRFACTKTAEKCLCSLFALV